MLNYRKDSLLLNPHAFTLAEVLITLGIIGVVAAITIPIVITNYQKQQTVTCLQKVFSTINQAAKLAEKDYGFMTTWAFPGPDWDQTESVNFWNNYSLIPYLSVAKTCVGADVSACWANNSKYLDGAVMGTNSVYTYVLLNNGVSILFAEVGSGCAAVYVDINGPKNPNICGKDIFRMDIGYQKGYVAFNGKGNSRTNLLSAMNHGCNKTSGTQMGLVCGALIQTDGWEIADDYPW